MPAIDQFALTDIGEKSMTKKNWIFIFFLGVAFLMWFIILFFGPANFVDENTHNRQIGRFLKGDYEILPSLTTIPGYHATIAFFAQFISHPSSKDIRLISFLLSVPSLWVFYAITKKLKVLNPLTKTLQFIFLPISFFYFPLVYTDIFSLLLVLLAFYFVLHKRYKLSALFSLASVLVRQTNIVWILFIWLYEYASINGFSISREKIVIYARRTIGHIAVFFAFIIFVWLNNGVAIGNRENQKAGFYMGNIYFFLVMAGFLFLPVLITSLGKLDRAKLRRFLIFGIGAGALVTCSFILFPPPVHEDNLKLHFLRNIILNYGYHQYIWAYALAIFLGYTTLFLMKFEKASFLLFPFIAASLLPSLLIEQRYAIVPMVFLLLLRKEAGRKTEFSLALYFIALSLGLMYMILKTALFF